MRAVAVAACAMVLAGCETLGYYLQAAGGQFEIARRAQKLEEVMVDPATSADLRGKLALAREIREFASRELGLPNNESYRRYADLGRPFVVWNVVAAEEFSTRAVESCFPVAGCVTYRGYFGEADAREHAEGLRGKGYDVQVSGIPAYSTLGWFDDPLLSTFIRYPEAELARLIFHPDDDALRKLKGGRKIPAPIDVLLATNMLSVGVDVKRLGLMVVAGQPKNTAEYIQATSRVGRSHPGLVCTIYNWARPRDLSHYETFEHYHATFYNHVEALSVTPFAPRAVDRGLTALLVSLIRLSTPRYAPNEAARVLRRDDPLVRRVVDLIARRAELVEESTARGDEVRKQLERRLDDWLAAVAPQAGGAKLAYKGQQDGVTRGLLKPAGSGPWEPFTCLNSLRDVEPTAQLVLEDGNLDDDARPFIRGEA